MLIFTCFLFPRFISFAFLKELTIIVISICISCDYVMFPILCCVVNLNWKESNSIFFYKNWLCFARLLFLIYSKLGQVAVRKYYYSKKVWSCIYGKEWMTVGIIWITSLVEISWSLLACQCLGNFPRNK